MEQHHEINMLLRLDQQSSMLAPLTYDEGQNLTAFLGGVLSKKYTNPSSDVIAILAGLDQVDKLVSDLVSGIDDLLRSGSDSESIRVNHDMKLMLPSSALQQSNQNCIGLDSWRISDWADLLPYTARSLSSIDAGKRSGLHI